MQDSGPLLLLKSQRGSWARQDAGSRNLYEGRGRELVEQIAGRLGARII